MIIDLIKENGLLLKKARSIGYPVETITDADYADDLAFLVDTHTQTEAILYSLEQATESIDSHLNTSKTEYMCFK